MDFTTFNLRREGLLQSFENDLTLTKNVTVQIARLDWIHPLYGGNKLFKLLPYLQNFYSQQYTSIISFGGPYSNHLFSLASICKELSIPSLGIVRSAIPIANATIDRLLAMKMKLVYLSKQRFDDFSFINQSRLVKDHSLENYLGEKPLWIELGGDGPTGILGASWIIPFLKEHHQDSIESITHCFVSVGTGTTFLGLKESLPKEVDCFGVASFKGAEGYFNSRPALNAYSSHLLTAFAGKGFGKYTVEELENYRNLKISKDLELDVVYTGKTFHALLSQIQSNKIAAGAKVLFIHTGGQQGNPTF